ncbi:hypothetical protein CDAR_603701 [Caerostris darwini]|uniref:Uncharacterized protein n=1 Tax=Caerostris darwini TaxID=1538125 RepID=A0AAV4T8R9_9ARAC|nr:hypothetical protein CDAR_603701 [Caerostris darwini]
MILFCFIGALCAATVLGNRCYSQEDCSEGECCTGGITPWLKGSCSNLAEEGEACDPATPSTGKYFLNCPCKEGLTCDDSAQVMGKIKCVRK